MMVESFVVNVGLLGVAQAVRERSNLTESGRGKGRARKRERERERGIEKVSCAYAIQKAVGMAHTAKSSTKIIRHPID